MQGARGCACLLEVWISQPYIARSNRGLQSRKPCRMLSRTVRIVSPVSRPSWSREAFSSEPSAVDTSSRKTAIPWTGSLQRGPWAVAS